MLKNKFTKYPELNIYLPFGNLEGHIFLFGRVGSAKSCIMMTLAQSFYDNYNYKIFDIGGGSRNEGKFWTLPSKENSFWRKLENLGAINGKGPKQYKVRLLYPYFEKKLPKKLPEKNTYTFG